MKKLLMILSLALLTVSAQAGKPWDNGKLRVSDNQRYLQFENGQPLPRQSGTSSRVPRLAIMWYRCKPLTECLPITSTDRCRTLTDGTSRTSIRKVSMAIGTTWTTSLTKLPTKVSISEWCASGVDW